MARIYVIDDDEQLLRMVGLMLERGGHKVTLINDPKHGLNQIKADKPDLLVLDVMMPGLSGHEVTRQIRATQSIADLPILILTARAQEIDRRTALESGADEYLSKPIVTQDLLMSVDDLLAKRGQTAEPETKKGMIVSVFGLRGGVGRTTIAVNLASALHRASQRQGQVCLLDLSTAGGQVVTHFRLQPTPNWQEMLSKGELPPVEQLSNYLQIHQNSGLYVLAAPALPQTNITTPNETQTKNLLELLRQQMRFIIVDLPAFLSPSALATLSFSDMVLHVVTPDLVSIQIGRQTNRAMVQENIHLNNKIHILNQNSAEARLPSSVVERGLNSRVGFNIEYDPNQARAIAQGIPLTLTNAQSPLPTMIKRLAEAIWQHGTK